MKKEDLGLITTGFFILFASNIIFVSCIIAFRDTIMDNIWYTLLYYLGWIFFGLLVPVGYMGVGYRNQEEEEDEDDEEDTTTD